MDVDGLKEVAPHYIALAILVVLVLTTVEAVVGELGFWPELAIVLGIAVAYRPLVVRLGVAPSGWQ
ncbi:hypothetical protein [Haloarcula salinisoli]|uniref:Uncharacterized protein n=1 Tax=Haloarcula salinisoli TaxID=2487746 RepID=A0A8J7YMT3_9EURY|nr:hypothetical protein [Halomicroarcula salinisoli]MBX0305659.1 hypothetical protein [Halomicroarcula salinisoli]